MRSRRTRPAGSARTTRKHRAQQRNKQTDRQTPGATNKQTNKQTNRPLRRGARKCTVWGAAWQRAVHRMLHMLCGVHRNVIRCIGRVACPNRACSMRCVRCSMQHATCRLHGPRLTGPAHSGMRFALQVCECGGQVALRPRGVAGVQCEGVDSTGVRRRDAHHLFAGKAGSKRSKQANKQTHPTVAQQEQERVRGKNE
jgi:hypothetical protein